MGASLVNYPRREISSHTIPRRSLISQEADIPPAPWDRPSLGHGEFGIVFWPSGFRGLGSQVIQIIGRGFGGGFGIPRLGRLGIPSPSPALGFVFAARRPAPFARWLGWGRLAIPGRRALLCDMSRIHRTNQEIFPFSLGRCDEAIAHRQQILGNSFQIRQLLIDPVNQQTAGFLPDIGHWGDNKRRCFRTLGFVFRHRFIVATIGKFVNP